MNPYPPKSVSGRYLSFEEREDIAAGVAAGFSQAEIARRLGRCVSTISREIAANSTSAKSHKPSMGMRYWASFAQSAADLRARRPKLRKLAVNRQLCSEVQARLDQ